LAVERGSRKTVAFLLVYGADVNLKNHENLTPLALANKTGHKDLVELLQKCGARD
jgi:ankyrin repeat protein